MVRARFVLALALLTPLAAHAQTGTAPVLYGQVVDAETGAPLPGAHVFLAASTLGTTTDADGRYRLDHAPDGTYEVAVSMLGYGLHVEAVALPRPGTPFDVRLQPAVLTLGEVTVSAARPPEWAFYLEQFKPLLLGGTPNADHCDLVNPDVLRFDVEAGTGRLQARAAAPLVVENRALGYRVHYYIADFTADPQMVRYKGTFRFEELEPRNRREQRRWKRHRRAAYEGSFAHFVQTLRQAHNDTDVRRAGFEVHVVTALDAGPGHAFAVDATRLLLPGARPDEQQLAFPDYLQVVYRPDVPPLTSAGVPGAPPPPMTGDYASWIKLRDEPAALDPFGHLSDPYAVTMYGLWSRERIADALPRDYTPTR